MIAERLAVSRRTVNRLLHKWDSIWEYYLQEQERLADTAECTVFDTLVQRKDIGAAGRMAQWLLTRARYKDRSMMDVSKVILEGGDSPIQHVAIPAEVLKLPVDVRKQILALADGDDEGEDDGDAA